MAASFNGDSFERFNFQIRFVFGFPGRFMRL